VSLFDRVVPVLETTEVDKTGKISCGVFIPLPRNLAKHFPDKSDEDDSIPHVTVLYIGEVTADEQTRVVEAVRECVTDWPPFTMNVRAYAEFKNEKAQTIAHMEPTADIRVKGPTGVYYRTIGELHADLFAAVESCGVLVGHTYGHTKVKPSFSDRARTFKLHTTLAYVNKGEPAYSGPKPTGSFMVTEVEVWGWEKYRIPLGKTTADQPCGAGMSPAPPFGSSMTDGGPPDIMQRAEFDNMEGGKVVKESRFLSLALGEADGANAGEGGAGHPAVEPGSKPGAPPAGGKPAKKASPDDEKAKKLKAALDRSLDPGRNQQPGVPRDEQEPEEPEFDPHFEHGHSIVVGSKHGAMPNLAPETIEKVKKHAKHGVHHEGPELDGNDGVSQFVHAHLGGDAQSWEAPDPQPGDPRWHPHLAQALFGGSTKTLHDAVTNHDEFDPKASIHDNLLATADAWFHPEHGAHVSSHDLNHLVKSVADDPSAAEVHAESKSLHKLLHGGMEGFKKFHKIGNDAMFPQDHGHHEHHTKISRIADTAHAARDAHLAHQMRTKGGVYFAGKDNVHAAAARLTRSGEKEESEGGPARTGTLFDRMLDSVVEGKAVEQSDMPGNKYQSVSVGSGRTGVGTAPPPEVGAIPLQTIKVGQKSGASGARMRARMKGNGGSD